MVKQLLFVFRFSMLCSYRPEISWKSSLADNYIEF